MPAANAALTKGVRDSVTIGVKTPPQDHQTRIPPPPMAPPDHHDQPPGDERRDDDSAAASGGERRRNERQIATFRTCCLVLSGGESHPAILRNMSDGGAMFEALVSPDIGDIVSYWWDGILPVEARVAWVKNARIGVANLSGPATAIPVPRPRATRVPVHLPVRVWTAGGAQRAELENISLSGIALHGLVGIEPGMLCTIEISGHSLPNACVVRRDERVVGIKFERPLSPAKLMQLLDGEGALAHVATGPTASHDAPSPAPHASQDDRTAQRQPAEPNKPAQPSTVRRFL